MLFDRRHCFLPCFCCLAALFWAWTSCPRAGAADLDPGNATWNIRIEDLWQSGRHLDVYPTFADGQWERAIATSREFNTSVHVVRENGFQRAGNKFSGTLEVLVTPDPWVPSDGQPQELKIGVSGHLAPVDDQDRPYTLAGTYQGTLDGKKVSGKISGGVSATEPGYEHAHWSVDLTPVLSPDTQKRSRIQVSVSVHDGKIVSGGVGCTWRRGPVRKYPFDVSSLASAHGKVNGSFNVPNRVIHIGGDPRATCDVEIDLTRIQGLVGGAASFQVHKGNKPAGQSFRAYGRGTANKIDGQRDADLPEPIWFHQVDNAPWWVPVKNHKPAGPGEHPRLYFRKGDIPALRKKAQTDEGKAIVARLRLLLGNDGEWLPDNFNKTPPHNHSKSGDQPLGTFTSFHPVGYGMLYTLTGEKKYADLARKSLELMFAGAMDRDNRYGWKTPGTHFRAAPVLAAVGFSYDMCYDAWPDDFRRKVALSIQNYNQREAESGGGKVLTLELLAGRTGYPPSSNHYGAMMAAATGVLAILRDPGTDTPRLEAVLADFEAQIPKALTYGFGDHGFYSEGHHPGRIFANLGLVPMLTALRNVTGRDYISPRPNAQWLTLHWVLEIVPQGGKPAFSHRGPYGGDDFDGGGMSHSGDFAHGFAAIDPKYVPALLWAYQNYVEPVRPHFGANTYPHRAVAALLNWPVGVKAQNPEKVLPKAVTDTIHGYFINRNRFRDGDDIVVTHFLQTGQEGYHRVKDAGKIHIRGLGLSVTLGTGMRGQPATFYENRPNGSSILSTVGNGQASSLAVDFSEVSGAAALLVGIGSAFDGASHKEKQEDDGTRTKLVTGKIADEPFAIFMLTRGEPPQVQVAGDALKIGNQTVRFDGRRIVLGKF